MKNQTRHLPASWLALALCFAVLVCPLARSQSLVQDTVLHNFGSADAGSNGANPYAGVILDHAGNVYGTTAKGGAFNMGEVYKVSATGQLKVLYSFKAEGYRDGANPYTPVTADAAGNIYGTTLNGDDNIGTVYEIDGTGHESVLHAFAGGSADGANPSSGVIRDPSGDLYGVTSKGGVANAGVVYKIDTSGQETVIYSFAGGKSDGAGPNSLIRDDAGDLYGTAATGGTNGQGVVFKIDTTGHETVVYHFSGGDGGGPLGVVIDSAGNLYGATASGGALSFGVVFKIDADGEQVLYSFKGAADGGNPVSGVSLDAAGNLYGATAHGGYGFGVIFKVDPAGEESVVYNFSGGSPAAGVTLDASDNLYGTTPLPGNGVVYKVNLSGQETILTSFTTVAGANGPQGPIAMDAAGNLYGAALYGGPGGDGVVYKLSPTGHETTLYAFSGGTGGGYPQGVTLDTEGNLYGVAQGGTPDQGLVYKLSPVGQETVLYTFTGEGDGGQPSPGVVLDSGGEHLRNDRCWRIRARSDIQTECCWPGNRSLQL
jgi:uncharacterized repeat protein (TIGR03803 family)